MDNALKLHRGRFAHTVFCDEIRREVNGKAIFIGVYDSDLYVPGLPITLPTFSVFVTVSSPTDMPIKKMIIRLYYGENVIAEAPVPDAELSDAFSEVSDSQFQDNDVMQVFRFTLAINISPFVIEKEGNLRVRVETDSEVLPGGALFIKVTDPAVLMSS